MSNDAKDFLDVCVEQAEQTLTSDRENESVILKFWDFQETINSIGQAIRKALNGSQGAQNLDMQKYYDAIEESKVLKVERSDFTESQIRTIAKSSFPSYIFAIYVCKGRFPEGEEAIQRNIKLWAEYDYVCTTFFDQGTINYGSSFGRRGYK
jgi:hypothetical protein